MALDHHDIRRRRQLDAIKSKEETYLMLAAKKGFPNCRGLYPDCPDKPDRENPQCRTCPILEEFLEKELD